MMDSFYRQPYQRRFVEPLMPMLANAGVTPNLLTAVALAAGLCIIPAAAIGNSTAALILLFLSGYLDSLDGALARYTHCSNSWGAVFDAVADRVVEFSIVMGLYFVDPDGRAFLCLLLLGSLFLCVATVLSSALFLKGSSSSTSAVIGRSEVFLFFGAMFLMPSLFFILAPFFAALAAATATYSLYQIRQ